MIPDYAFQLYIFVQIVTSTIIIIINKSVNSLRYADEVSIGNEVLVEAIGHLIPTKVIDISDFIMKGKHKPLILSQE